MGHVGLEGDIGQVGLRQVDVEVGVAKEGIGHVGAPEGLERIFLPRLSSQAVAGRQGWVTPNLDPSEGGTEPNIVNARLSTLLYKKIIIHNALSNKRNHSHIVTQDTSGCKIGVEISFTSPTTIGICLKLNKVKQ